MSTYNFNFNAAPEYELNSSLIDEVINLYGISVKFLKVQHLNLDDIVFKDFDAIKTDENNIFTINMLPENSEGWDNNGYNFSQFGMIDMNNINLFCSKMSFEMMSLNVKNVLGNLVITPNNKIFEITNCEFTVPGMNNLFTYNNQKSVYKLTLIPYNVKIQDELDEVQIMHQDTADLGKTGYDTLNKYFDELINVKQKQDIETEILDSVKTVHKTGNLDKEDIIINKPIIDKSEDDIFGNF